jgi:hypothetical protein
MTSPAPAEQDEHTVQVEHVQQEQEHVQMRDWYPLESSPDVLTQLARVC